MATFLLTWNPNSFDWESLADDVEAVRNGDAAEEDWNWSVGVRKSGIGPGDRFFMLRQGAEPRGIMASGTINSDVYQDEHWNDPTKSANAVDITFETLIDPNEEPERMIPMRDLIERFQGRFYFTRVQSSGQRLPDDVAHEIERMWAERVGERRGSLGDQEDDEAEDRSQKRQGRAEKPSSPQKRGQREVRSPKMAQQKKISHTDLQVLRLKQNGTTIYLTAVSAAVLTEWEQAGVLFVDRFSKSESGEFVGYQRILSDKRINQLARFLTGKGQSTDVILPILPQSVFLNIRPNSAQPEFTADSNSNAPLVSGRLRIFERTRLAEVDGQHRIRGLIAASQHESSLKNFLLTVSIVEGLRLSQEAAQFLTVNRSQKKVEADLELRVVFHRDKKECSRLVTALGFDEWRIPALALTIALNDTIPSPWENSISRPGEGRRRGVSEKAFVGSLEPILSRTRVLARQPQDTIERFLKDFWAVVAEKCPNAWSDEERRFYLLRKTLGVDSMHLIAPLVFDLSQLWYDEADRGTIREIMQPVFKSYPERAWRASDGRFAELGSGKDAARQVGLLMASRLVPGFEPDAKTYRKFSNRKLLGWLQTCLNRARNMLQPLGLRVFEPESVSTVASAGAGGAYVLVAMNQRTGEPKAVYVGKSEKDLRKRLYDHFDDTTRWELFMAEQTSDPKRCAAYEGALWHLAPRGVLLNRKHPPDCVFCER